MQGERWPWAGCVTSTQEFKLQGLQKEPYFPHSLRQQKRMLEKRSSRGNCKDKGTGKVSRANRLSSEPPQAGGPGTPRDCSPNTSCKLQSPTQCLEGGTTPQGPSYPCLSPFLGSLCGCTRPGLLFGGALIVGHPGLGC